MEDTRGPSALDALEGPHLNLCPEVPAGFMPLHLVLEPIGPRIEVHRPDVTVGRHSEAEVRLGLPDISRRHCRLVFENQHWRVIDLNSLNGVFVNGERMQEATLYHGDQLQLGTCTFVIEYAAPAAVSRNEGIPEESPRGEVLQSIAEAIKEQKRAS
jgi:pSer/pThr/pTyr-binding forkhead associated (FHA) protein